MRLWAKFKDYWKVSKPANIGLKLMLCIVLLLHHLNICPRIEGQSRLVICEEHKVMVWHNI